MENNICSCVDCELEVYEESDKCVLHCKKNNQYKHTHQNLYKSFIEALIVEIARQVNHNAEEERYIVDEERVIKALKRQSIERVFEDEGVQNIVRNAFTKIINLTHIIFPPRKSQDYFDYERVLIQLKAIQFNFCQFNTDNLLLDNITCFFADCIFLKDWSCPPCLKWNKKEVIYQACKFKGKVSNYSSEDRSEKISIYSVPLFDYLCNFEEEISFDNAKFKEAIFYSSIIQKRAKEAFFKKIYFKNCIFENTFKLNNCRIDDFICEDTIFIKKSKFEFKNNNVDKFEIKNTNFSVLVDCIETRFQSFYVEKSIFEKFTGFEKCKFGELKKEDNIVTFEYATFLNFVNFRDAKFYSGLDLRNGNFKESLNFLDVEVEPKNTNRETFRIIKHSFDSVGNLIEANKFFAYEMKKERENTVFEDNPNKKIMLNFNYWISNFGQSWLKPLGLTLLVAIFHTLLIYTIDSKIFQFINSSNLLYEPLKLLGDFFDDIAKNILPFKKPLIAGKEFISLIFLIVYSTLIYNFVVAVKRITKR